MLVTYTYPVLTSAGSYTCSLTRLLFLRRSVFYFVTKLLFFCLPPTMLLRLWWRHCLSGSGRFSHCHGKMQLSVTRCTVLFMPKHRSVKRMLASALFGKRQKEPCPSLDGLHSYSSSSWPPHNRRPMASTLPEGQLRENEGSHRKVQKHHNEQSVTSISQYRC
jgi:hypothetical protein